MYIILLWSSTLVVLNYTKHNLLKWKSVFDYQNWRNNVNTRWISYLRIKSKMFTTSVAMPSNRKCVWSAVCADAMRFSVLLILFSFHVVFVCSKYLIFFILFCVFHHNMMWLCLVWVSEWSMFCNHDACVLKIERKMCVCVCECARARLGATTPGAQP